ncbi:hypothetical protein [Streptomyces litchfieldiae]|uniref:Uncharacterized protein n=1 Tax=Streptomyces litchfieldiae TaxID=3075543 RepID=A0ABU2N105_9ACTN|nr:hypothetical protein [Streptomyces sp. DSM 44938]MDT0347565.1 hypothetical protein [Streptomyces sp. DSM 44938]
MIWVGVVGAILAYVIFGLAGVTSYILVISGFGAAFLLWILARIAVGVVSYIREVAIPERRRAKVTLAHNSHSQERVTILSVISVRLLDAGLIYGKGDNQPSSAEFDADGKTPDEINSLFGESLHAVIAPGEVELWKQQGSSYVVALAFDKRHISKIRRIDDHPGRLVLCPPPKDGPQAGENIMELRFTNDSYIRLIMVNK